MAFPLRLDELKSGQGLWQIKAEDLATMARMLNGLRIEMITGQDYAEIVPPDQSGRGWIFRIPSGGADVDTIGKTKHMVYQITDDTTSPPTAGFDWVRAHA